MRIFIVQSHLGGGGAERVGSILADGFVHRNHDVFMVTNLLDEMQYQVDENVTILSLVSSNQNKMKKWGGAVRNLRRYVKGYQPDIVIGIMELCSFISKIACIGTAVHVIMTEHYTFDRTPYSTLTRMERLSKFYVNRFYEVVTVLTKVDKDYIGNRLKHVVIMPNPLLLESVKEIPQKENIVLAAGRIDAWHVKGFDILIRAWSSIVKSERRIVNGEGWRLKIAGAGSEESLNYLKQLCREKEVEDYVDFLGHVKDMESLYRQASIFVLSSRYEGFGLVLIEAMSQGCACVACDYKGRQREILAPKELSVKCKVQSVKGADSGDSNYRKDMKIETTQELDTAPIRGVETCETGILCEPDNVEALANALEKMITDDVYRESTRRNAIRRSEYYSIENTMDRWEALLASLKGSQP